METSLHLRHLVSGMTANKLALLRSAIVDADSQVPRQLGRALLNARRRSRPVQALAQPERACPKPLPVLRDADDIQAIRCSSDGKVLAAACSDKVFRFDGRDTLCIDELGRFILELSQDGRFVLAMQEFQVQVYDAAGRLKRSLKPDSGLHSVVPSPDGAAFTLCSAHNAHTPLTWWRLENGEGTTHKMEGFPACMAIHDKHYVVASMSGELFYRTAKGGGRTLFKLQIETGDFDNEPWMLSLNDTHVAALLQEGTFLLWRLGKGKGKVRAKLIADHRGLGPYGAMVMDPDTSWSCVSSCSGATVFDPLGNPAYELPLGPWIETDYFPRDYLAFARSGVLVTRDAEGVDTWRIGETPEHLWHFAGKTSGLAVCPDAVFVASGSQALRIPLES